VLHHIGGDVLGRNGNNHMHVISAAIDRINIYLQLGRLVYKIPL